MHVKILDRHFAATSWDMLVFGMLTFVNPSDSARETVLTSQVALVRKCAAHSSREKRAREIAVVLCLATHCERNARCAKCKHVLFRIYSRATSEDLI
jgi:hypothetical protein